MVYREQDRQAAYELYRGNPNRSLEQLADDLEALPNGVRVPVDTIRDWRNRYTWEQRIQEEIASAAPILINAHVSLARAAGLDGLSYIRDVANGSQEFDKHRYDAAKFLVEEVRPMLKFVTAEDDAVQVKPIDLRAKLLNARLPGDNQTAERLVRLTNQELVAMEETPGWTG